MLRAGSAHHCTGVAHQDKVGIAEQGPQAGVAAPLQRRLQGCGRRPASCPPGPGQAGQQIQRLGAGQGRLLDP